MFKVKAYHAALAKAFVSLLLNISLKDKKMYKGGIFIFHAGY